MPRWLHRILYRGEGRGYSVDMTELFIHEANPLMKAGRVMAGINPIHQASAYVAYPQPLQPARRGVQGQAVAWSENDPLAPLVMDLIDPVWDPGALRQYSPSAMPVYNPTLTGSSI